MIIEYRVYNANDKTIFPFTPQYRRKLTGLWSLFQFMFSWNNFPCYSIDGELCRHKRFGKFNDAAAFLRSVESPSAYFEDLKRSRPRQPNHCHFQKEY